MSKGENDNYIKALKMAQTIVLACDSLIQSYDVLYEKYDELRERTRWIPVEEWLPDYSIKVELLNKWDQVVSGIRESEERWNIAFCGSHPIYPQECERDGEFEFTHWRYGALLPNPPEVKDEQD